jgi:hypothetical protein
MKLENVFKISVLGLFFAFSGRAQAQDSWGFPGPLQGKLTVQDPHFALKDGEGSHGLKEGSVSVYLSGSFFGWTSPELNF